MATRNSVFMTVRQHGVSKSIKIPNELHGRIEALRARLAEVDDSLGFNISAICVDALEDAVMQGEVEIRRLQKASGTTSGSGTSA